MRFLTILVLLAASSFVVAQPPGCVNVPRSEWESVVAKLEQVPEHRSAAAEFRSFDAKYYKGNDMLPVYTDSWPVWKDRAKNGKTAMERVNSKRATRGLRPFVEDPVLTAAAQKCADYRAANNIYGHSRDFDWIPPGHPHGPAGCEGFACWDVATTQLFGGWGSCCEDENWTHAGAGMVIRNGHCFMELIVR